MNDFKNNKKITINYAIEILEKIRDEKGSGDYELAVIDDILDEYKLVDISFNKIRDKCILWVE